MKTLFHIFINTFWVFAIYLFISYLSSFFFYLILTTSGFHIHMLTPLHCSTARLLASGLSRLTNYRISNYYILFTLTATDKYKWTFSIHKTVSRLHRWYKWKISEKPPKTTESKNHTKTDSKRMISNRGATNKTEWTPACSIRVIPEL